MSGNKAEESPADPKIARVIFARTCFAEYRPDADGQPWSIQKYATDWHFCLDREEDVIELMKRLDGLG